MARLTSPFALPSVEEAFIAYCNMPHAQRAGWKRPTKAQFHKMYNDRHEVAVEDTTETQENTPAIDLSGFDPAVLEVLAALFGGTVPESAKPEPTKKSYRKLITAFPEGAASNGVLWRLNVEGFLTIDTTGTSDPIMQDDGQSTLTATFGPQQKAKRS